MPCIKLLAQLACLMVKYSFSRALPKEIVGSVLKDVEKLIVATYERLLGTNLNLNFDLILPRRIIIVFLC